VSGFNTTRNYAYNINFNVTSHVNGSGVKESYYHLVTAHWKRSLKELNIKTYKILVTFSNNICLPKFGLSLNCVLFPFPAVCEVEFNSNMKLKFVIKRCLLKPISFIFKVPILLHKIHSSVSTWRVEKFKFLRQYFLLLPVVFP
jgi:hypothetical protein